MIISFKNINGGGGGGYVLPTATPTRLGGVKIGDGINVDSAGTISVSGTDIEQNYEIIRGSIETVENYEAGKMYATTSTAETMSTIEYNSSDEDFNILNTASVAKFQAIDASAECEIDTYYDFYPQAQIDIYANTNNGLVVDYYNRGKTNVYNGEPLTKDEINTFELPSFTFTGSGQYDPVVFENCSVDVYLGSDGFSFIAIKANGVEIDESGNVLTYATGHTSLEKLQARPSGWTYNVNADFISGVTYGNNGYEFDKLYLGTDNNNVIEVPTQPTSIPTATTENAGIVKIGQGINVDFDGTISVSGGDSTKLVSVSELPSSGQGSDTVRSYVSSSVTESYGYVLDNNGSFMDENTSTTINDGVFDVVKGNLQPTSGNDVLMATFNFYGNCFVYLTDLGNGDFGYIVRNENDYWGPFTLSLVEGQNHQEWEESGNIIQISLIDDTATGGDIHLQVYINVEYTLNAVYSQDFGTITYDDKLWVYNPNSGYCMHYAIYNDIKAERVIYYEDPINIAPFALCNEDWGQSIGNGNYEQIEFDGDTWYWYTDNQQSSLRTSCGKYGTMEDNGCVISFSEGQIDIVAKPNFYKLYPLNDTNKVSEAHYEPVGWYEKCKSIDKFSPISNVQIYSSSRASYSDGYITPLTLSAGGGIDAGMIGVKNLKDFVEVSGNSFTLDLKMVPNIDSLNFFNMSYNGNEGGYWVDIFSIGNGLLRIYNGSNSGETTASTGSFTFFENTDNETQITITNDHVATFTFTTLTNLNEIKDTIPILCGAFRDKDYEYKLYPLIYYNR